VSVDHPDKEEPGRLLEQAPGVVPTSTKEFENMDRIAQAGVGVEADAEEVPVRLPGVKAPALAAFERSASAVRTLFQAWEADPFLGECPPWCMYLDGLEPGEVAHSVGARAGARRHESVPLAVPVNSVPGTIRRNGSVLVGRLTVAVESFVALPGAVATFVALEKHGRAECGDKGTEAREVLATLTPGEAAALARALATAARLADPDLDVDGASW
jgi:hypothetical protein